jgi:hypothetical protein
MHVSKGHKAMRTSDKQTIENFLHRGKGQIGNERLNGVPNHHLADQGLTLDKEGRSALTLSSDLQGREQIFFTKVERRSRNLLQPNNKLRDSIFMGLV